MYQDTRFHLWYYLDLMFRRRWVFLGVLILVVAGMLAWSFTMDPVYRAETLIYVKESKVLKPLMRGLAVTQSMKDRLQTINQMVLSRSNLLRIMRKLGMDLEAQTPHKLEWQIQKLRSNIQISTKGRDIFEIAYQSNNPREAMTVANALAEQYIEDSLNATRQEAHQAYAFIQEQLALYKEKLEASEKALLEFKMAHFGELPSQGLERATLAKIEELAAQLMDTRMKLRDLSRKRDQVLQQLEEEEPLIVASATGAGPVNVQLSRLEAKLAALLLEYTEKHPAVVQLKEQIEEARKQLQQGQHGILSDAPESMTTAANPIYQQLRAELKELDAEIASLRSRESQLVRLLRTYETKAANLPKREQQLAQLTRDNAVNTRIYEMLLKRLEDARMSKEMEVREKGSTFRIVDPATLPLYPVKPDRIKMVLLGLALGLFLGAAVVVGLDYLANPFKRLEEVTEVLHLPVLAAIPSIVTPADRSRLRRSNYATAAVVGAVILAVGAVIVRELMIRNPYFLHSLKHWIS